MKLNSSPEKHIFEDDGIIPNSKYPVLIYRNAFSERNDKGAEWLEDTFRENNWENSWRWGIYPFHHYHSNTHEVLGVFQGTAEIQLGGPKGEKINIFAGDVIIIPAGVGHKCISHTEDFTVVGAYPDGKEPDLIKEGQDKHDSSLKNIAEVELPSKDPLFGSSDGLVKIWKN